MTRSVLVACIDRRTAYDSRSCDRRRQTMTGSGTADELISFRITRPGHWWCTAPLTVPSAGIRLQQRSISRFMRDTAREPERALFSSR